MKWRVGQSLGRTLYIQNGQWPSKVDQFVGIMDSRELAEDVVTAMNILQDMSKLNQNLEEEEVAE